MSLKLIQQAQTLSKLTPTELAAFRVIQESTGNKTLAEIVNEAFKPSPRDYKEWLRVVVGYAKDGKISLNSKATFSDIAGAVLENDPANPSVEMHASIINKLWSDYKASKHHAKVSQIAAAKEEEEADMDDEDGYCATCQGSGEGSYEGTRCRTCGGTGSAHRRLGRDPEDNPRDNSDYRHGLEDEQWDDAADLAYDRARDEKLLRSAKSSQEDEEDGVDDYDRADPGRDEIIGDEDSRDTTGRFGASEEPEGEDEVTCPECGCEFHPGEECKDDDLDRKGGYNDTEDLGNSVEGAERLGKMGNKPFGHLGDDDLAYQEEESAYESRVVNHRGPMSAKMGEEVTQKPKSILHQVLTAPKDQMNKALKDIESDGSAAWLAHKLPANPHDKGSIAHKRWAAGFKKAVKSHFGLDAPAPAAKPKKR